MRIKIRPYLKFLLIENTIYIVLAFILIIAILFIPSYFLNKFSANQEEISQLEEELKQMQSKKNALIFLSSSKSQNLDEYYNLMTSLIPESENYFSILYTLENLSRLTNFNITSYTINLAKSNENKLSVDVSGVGEQEDFLNFLNQYNVAGGRLITAEKINLGKDNTSGLTLSLNFYNKKSSLFQSTKEDYQKTLVKLNDIRDKVKFTFKNQEITQSNNVDETTESYPIKTNPF
jgi:hypothetical protein